MGLFTVKFKRSGLCVSMIRNSKSPCSYINTCMFNEAKKFTATNIILLCLTTNLVELSLKNMLKLTCTLFLLLFALRKNKCQ